MLSALLPPGIGRVGVFVDADPDTMAQAARAARLTHLQLHGSEPPEIIPTLPLPVIKSLRLKGPGDLNLIARYAGVANCLALLVEPYVPQAPGGTGAVLDWTVACQARDFARARGARFILSGGLTPYNVGRAVRQVTPDGVDVSTGVETDGRKDVLKIFAFVAEARLSPRATHLWAKCQVSGAMRRLAPNLVSTKRSHS